MCLSTWATLVTAGVMLAACATAGLTPRQEAGLREAQEIADRTTDAYRVSRVKVFAVPLLRSAGVYRPRSDWIMLQPAMLDDVDFLSVLAHELGHATLGHKMLGTDICDPAGASAQGLWECRGISTPTGRQWLQQAELDANARAVDIMVRVMRMTHAAALRRFTALLMRSANAPPVRGYFGGCREIEDLLARFPPVTEFPPPQTCGPR